MAPKSSGRSNQSGAALALSWLKRASDNGRKPVKQVVFAGERFDVMSVRRWREKVLGARP